MLSVKHLRGYFRYLALAFLIVVIAVSCCFVGAGSAALHQEVFVGVPAGYFDGVMPYGSVVVMILRCYRQ